MHWELTNTTWGWPRISSTKSTSKHRIQYTGSSSKSRKLITNLLSKCWMNGWNWVSLRGQIHTITHPFSAFLKKQGQGLQIVQDFRELNQNFHIDKNSMKEIMECIGDIGWADSTIFMMLDLTSGFWQMQLDEDFQKLNLPFWAKVSSTGSPHLWDYWGVQPVFNDWWKKYYETFQMCWS